MGRGWLDANLGLLLQALTVAQLEGEEPCGDGGGGVSVVVRRRWVVARVGGRALRFRRKVRLPPLLSAAAVVYQLAAGSVGRGVVAPPGAEVLVVAGGRAARTTVLELVHLWERKGWELIWRSSHA